MQAVLQTHIVHQSYISEVSSSFFMICSVRRFAQSIGLGLNEREKGMFFFVIVLRKNV